MRVSKPKSAFDLSETNTRARVNRDLCVFVQLEIFSPPALSSSSFCPCLHLLPFPFTTPTIRSRAGVSAAWRVYNRLLSCASNPETSRLAKLPLQYPTHQQLKMDGNANAGWAVPSWDSLFAGRKTSLTARKEEEEEEEEEEAATASRQNKAASSPREVKIVASQGQDAMEAELQTAADEQMPNAVSSPPLAHLAEFKSSPRASIDHGLASNRAYPEVIRKSQDGYTRAQAGLSMPHVAFTSSNTFSGPAVPERVDTKSPVAVPQEVHQDRQPESPLRPLSTIQRAGRQEASSVTNLQAGVDITTDNNDTPSGQWAEGAAPVSSAEEAHLQADLWDTMSSLVGIRRSPSSSSEADDNKEGFLGAVSRLQSLLGESAVERNQWKNDQEGDIDKVFSLASSSSSPPSDPGEGHGESYTAASGVRYQPTYLLPRLPLVLCHGLFGFGEFSLAPASLRESLPALSIVYWRGIADTLQRRGVEVLVAKVPTSASIDERAEELRQLIEQTYPHREINLIGHSMGGLDSRLVANLDTTFTVRSVTTIATPHRGSPFADYLLDQVIGKQRLPTLLNLVEKAGIPGGGRAFACLTTHAMKEDFNERCPDNPKTIYMSWGAAFQPGLLHEFRWPWAKVKQVEGDNDGLVSVESAKWGEYKGTLKASHLDLIGWTNRVANFTASISTKEQRFDPLQLYLTIAEDLALLGL